MSKLAHLLTQAATERRLSRRGFLIGSTGLGVTLAFGPSVVAEPDPDGAVADSRFEPTIWYDIDRDGIVTVNVAEAEMGQHVGTALARIVADELEADWQDVRLKHVDSDPKWGYMVTGGSWSVWQNFVPLSRAGAAGRQVLIENGAALLGVEASECKARDSRVHAGDRSVSYADIVRQGSLSRSYTADELEQFELKPASQRRLVGKDAHALDLPSKVDGSARYGIDADIDGMVYARPLIPPTRYGASVIDVDDSAAQDVPGYLRTIVLDDPSGTVPGWAAVLATNYPAAIKAADAVKVKWQAGKTADVSEKALLDRGRTLIDDAGSGSLVVNDEGIDAAFQSADSELEQVYTTSTVLHFQLEPLNATVWQKDGTWHVHTGNQWQSLILPTLATALKTDESNILMHTYLLGGGFGRRLNGDYTVPAALAAQAHGGPVKMVFTREDDARFDSVRSASIQRVRMGFDAQRKPIAMQHDAASGWPTLAMAPGFMPKGKNDVPYDPFAIHGGDHWYSVGAHRLRAIENDLANDTFRPGWLRSVGSGWVNWALESFMDEAARQIDADPVEFRLSLLKAEGKNAGSAPNSVGGASRQANVLRRVAKRAGWGRSMPENSGLGVATTFGQERNMPTWVACVAQVAVDPATGAVKLQKLTLSVDAGVIVHPDGALAQMEGAALWGASMALHEGTQFERGEVKDRNLDGYTPLRMQNVPAIDVDFVASTETPVGLGEPATTVVGPAIGNAIFAAIGVRLRDLPIRSADVKAAIDARARKA